MNQITVKQNDKGYDIVFQLLKEDGTVLDLTDTTSIEFHAVKEKNKNKTINGLLTVNNATEGLCVYTVANGNFDEEGTYLAEIQTNFGVNKSITLPTFQIIVEKEIG